MELLAGAGKGREVWRIGDTVRRAVGPQTPAVHALLRHLEAVGFDGAPRVLGFDEQGREVLSYVEGESGRHGPYDDQTLAETDRTIRRFHDAVAGFVPPPDSVWRQTTCRHRTPPTRSVAMPCTSTGNWTVSCRCMSTMTASGSGFGRAALPAGFVSMLSEHRARAGQT